jgi:hypothetical protein
MSNAAARARVCFQSAELYYNSELAVVGLACYSEGLRILLEESDGIKPLEYLELCVQEQHLLLTYIIPPPGEPPCPFSS